jgi:predicted PurR-regulated permease PerM
MPKLNTFFLSLLAASFILLAYLFYPFLGALTLALALAIAFRPVFRYFLRHWSGRRGLAAWGTILVILIIVIVPLFLIGIRVWGEIGGLYNEYLTGGVMGGFQSGPLAELVARYAPGISVDLPQFQARIIEWLFTNLNNIFSSIVGVAFNLLIIFITLFFLFKDGHRFKTALRRLSPLSDSQDRAIVDRLEDTINSVVKGTVLVALIQGLLTGFGFAIFGVQESILWGILGALTSIVPGVGTGMVFIPVVVFFAATGSYALAIKLTIWGVLVVGMIDNFLRPFLVERGVGIHPLFTLLSILGGLEIFGAIGLILGPIVLSFAVTLAQMYLVGKQEA